MNRGKIIVVVIFSFILIVSCSFFTSENTLLGKYAPVGYKKNFDTIILKSNQIYSRKIYNNEKRMVFSTTGKWKLIDNTKIEFENFFENFDRDIERYPELLSDTLGGVEVVVEQSISKTSFCFGYFQGENCYNKID